MSDRAVLLVTGSRALADTDAAYRWAIARLTSALPAHDPLCTRLITGDARGPDAWVWELQTEVAAPRERWCLDGRVMVSLGTLAPHVEAWWSTAVMARTATSRSTRPLARDHAMVAHVAGLLGRGDAVQCLALIAPWSRTHGTQYTASLAERAGIPTTRLVCPTDRGPGVV